MRQGGLILAAGRVRSKRKKTKIIIITKNPAAPKTHHESTAAGDRDHLETACNKTRPTR